MNHKEVAFELVKYGFVETRLDKKTHEQQFRATDKGVIAFELLDKLVGLVE